MNKYLLLTIIYALFSMHIQHACPCMPSTEDQPFFEENNEETEESDKKGIS